jgi:hypothetical protein
LRLRGGYLISHSPACHLAIKSKALFGEFAKL